MLEGKPRKPDQSNRDWKLKTQSTQYPLPPARLELGSYEARTPQSTPTWPHVLMANFLYNPLVTHKKFNFPDFKSPLFCPSLISNYSAFYFSRHNFGKAVQAKSTVQLEMEKIEHFRQELAAKRKQSQQSFKAVKESAPHLPVRSSTKATKAEAFKFETDSRLKSHPMETRNDARTPNFQGNLRKYSPSSVSILQMALPLENLNVKWETLKGHQSHCLLWPIVVPWLMCSFIITQASYLTMAI